MEAIRKKLRALWADKRGYRARLLHAAAVLGALCFTWLFFGPLELLAFSGGSLVLGWQELLLPLLGLMLGLWAAGSALAALLRGKVFNYALCLLFTLALGGYLQGALLNSGLGLLTGDTPNWSGMAAGALWGLVLWGAILALSLLGQYLSRRRWTQVTAALCLLLVIMQLVPAAAIVAGVYDTARPTQDLYLSQEGYYTLSAEENILVIVLDRLDFDYVEQVLARDPDFFDPLEGFTAYDNAISAYARTRPALAHLLTGQEGAYYRSAQDYFAAAWEGGLLESLSAAGYENYLYTDLRNLFSRAEDTAPVANATTGREGVDYSVALGKLWQLSAYRYAPTALKPSFYGDTNYFNAGVYRSDAYGAYEFNDGVWGPGLSGVTAGGGKQFRLYHFSGSHAPYTLGADGRIAGEETSAWEQTAGCFQNLFGLFARMQELGIYEDATILITGDHGSAVSDYTPLQKATRVGLFYKPAGASGTPLAWDSSPVSTGDIGPTVLRAAGCAYTGYPLGTAPADRVRTYYKTTIDRETYRETTLYTYAVRGQAAVFANWELVSQEPIDHNYN